MKKFAFIISILSLLLTLLPSFFVYFSVISLEMSKDLMLLGTIGWFSTAWLWMNQNSSEGPEPEEAN